MGKTQSSARAQRRANERASKKQSKAQSISCSKSFSKIVPLLEDLNWRHFSDNSVPTNTGENGRLKVIKTQSMVLTNESFCLTLSSYKDGVNIGKIEVWNDDCIKIDEAKKIVAATLSFLKSNEIDNVYAITAFVGHFKEKDVVLEKFQLDLLYKEFGFVETDVNGVLKLVNYDNLIDYTDLDETIIFGTPDIISTGDNAVFYRGQVQVYFDFANSPNKSFTRSFYVGTDDEIRSKINFFLSQIKVESKEDEMVKFTLEQVLDDNSMLPFEVRSQLFQNMMGVFLAASAKESDYQNEMTYSSNFYIAVLHLLINGNEKNVAQYRLFFDERRETMDIATRIAP